MTHPKLETEDPELTNSFVRLEQATMYACRGCNWPFPSRKSLNAHIARSRNPRCKLKARWGKQPSPRAGTSQAPQPSGEEELEDSDDDEADTLESTSVAEPHRFEGDFFGTADEYADDDLPGWSEQDISPAYGANAEDVPVDSEPPLSPSEADSDAEDVLAASAEAAEQTWEPTLWKGVAFYEVVEYSRGIFVYRGNVNE